MMAADAKRLNGSTRVWIGKDGEPIDTRRALDVARERESLSRRQQALLAAAGESGPYRRWYVLQVLVGHENAVDDELTALGVETWMPVDLMLPKRRRRRFSGERCMMEQPALPGYMFIHVTPIDRILVGIKSVESVVGMVGGWEHPQPVSDNDLNRFRLFLGLTPKERRKLLADEKRAKLGIAEGDAVAVTEGPFKGIKGTVRRAADDVAIWVELTIFGGIVPASIPLASLAKSD